MTKLILKSKAFPGELIEVLPSQLPLIVGRSHSADITINDSQMSRKHCELKYGSDGTFEISDLDSTNLTIVNQQDIVKQTLFTGDVILLGDTEIEATVVGAEGDPNEDTTRELTVIPQDQTIED